MKTRYVWWLMLAGLLVAALRMVIAHDAAGQVVRHPDPTRSLAERWDWAIEEANRQNTDVWIGYSIERMMRPHSNLMIGPNMSFHNGQMQSDGPTLADRLAGRAPMPVPSDDEAVRREAQRWLNGDDEGHEDGPPVPKDIAILFRYAPGATRPDAYKSMIIGNVDLDLDLDRRPLVWLGSAADEESLNWLARRYRAATTEKQKERLIAAQGVHDAPRQVVPLLQDILQSDEGEEVREAAAHWLGWQHDPAAVRLLDETARNDRSDEVREAAVFGLSQAELPEATQALIRLARSGDDPEVRENAVFWLGQQGSPEAIALLDDLALHDPDRDIQEKAVFAISQLPDEDGIPRLLKLAKKHPNRETRKEAIFWLGQAAGDRAAEALGDIAVNDEETDVQKQAVFAISQLDDGGVPMLIEISKTHTNPKVRKEAIFWLGQSDDPRALEALEALLRQ